MTMVGHTALRLPFTSGWRPVAGNLTALHVSRLDLFTAVFGCIKNLESDSMVARRPGF